MPQSPEKENWIFVDWVDVDDKKISGEEIVKSNVEYFAKWEFDAETVVSTIESLKDRLTNYSFIFCISAGALLLFIAALFMLMMIKTKSLVKKVRSEIKQSVFELTEKQRAAEKNNEARFYNLEKNVTRNNETPRTAPTQDNSAQYQREIANLQNEKRMLEEKNRALNESKNIADGIASGALDPLSIFNEWAASPSGALSKDSFYYISGGTPKIRSEQNLSESAEETACITNRAGAKKYLLPNPRLLDDRSNITLFYTNGSGFKGKGQNKIRITKPCEIGNAGYIQYPGELAIL